MSTTSSIHERLLRLAQNVSPLPSMAMMATRKSDRESLRLSLLHFRSQLFHLVEDTDPRLETEVMPDKAIVRHVHEMLEILITRYIEVREAAIEAGTDPDQIALSSAHAAACEMLLAAMQAFWGLEISNA